MITVFWTPSRDRRGTRSLPHCTRGVLVTGIAGQDTIGTGNLALSTSSSAFAVNDPFRSTEQGTANRACTAGGTRSTGTPNAHVVARGHRFRVRIARSAVVHTHTQIR